MQIKQTQGHHKLSTRFSLIDHYCLENNVQKEQLEITGQPMSQEERGHHRAKLLRAT